MAKMIEAAGYMIQDNHGYMICGIGSTVDEAWAMVVDGIGTFFDAHGNDIPADQAYETQFKTYGATAAFMEAVKDWGQDFRWRVVGGIACTVEEEEAATA